MPFWDEVVREVAEDYPDVEWDQLHIDALAAAVVLDPARFDVIVGSNLFGDILSDLTAAVAGSLGLAPSANLDPTGEFPSMFEPVHGSAPDIAGQGRRQPGRRRLVGGDDARPPRPRRRRGPGAARPWSPPWPTPPPAPPTSAAPPRPRRPEPRSCSLLLG